MKRLKKGISEEKFKDFREKVSIIKKHFDVEVGLIMNIK